MISPAPRSREARTRGPQLDAPLNRPDVDTPVPYKPTRYTRHDLRGEERIIMLAQAWQCGLAAMTDSECADSFGVTVPTIMRWRAEDQRFDEAFTIGGALSVARVEASLFRRAVGYQFASEKIFSTPDGVVRVPIVEHVPPDVGAMKYWLGNRAADRWREAKQEIEVGGAIDIHTKAQDPRTLALALLAVLRDAAREAKVLDMERV